MKKYFLIHFVSILCFINYSSLAQGLFAESKCTSLYYGYENNQVFFNSKIDTNKVKFIGEGCEIKMNSDKMALVFISIKNMNTYFKVENPSVSIKIIDKDTEGLLDEKLFEIKRIPTYTVLIDESTESNKLELTNGLISYRCPDEGTTCYLPRLDEYITDYQITIQGLNDILTGIGTKIQKKQLKTIKKFKQKNKSEVLKVTLTLTVIDPTNTEIKKKKVCSFNY